MNTLITFFFEKFSGTFWTTFSLMICFFSFPDGTPLQPSFGISNGLQTITHPVQKNSEDMLQKRCLFSKGLYILNLVFQREIRGLNVAHLFLSNKRISCKLQTSQAKIFDAFLMWTFPHVEKASFHM